jgi:hypothetical protein
LTSLRGALPISLPYRHRISNLLLCVKRIVLRHVGGIIGGSGAIKSIWQLTQG